jgi:type 1 fimbriae regulatory protein FimB/type 1 fimbriae regulatory protein FimE
MGNLIQLRHEVEVAPKARPSKCRTPANPYSAKRPREHLTEQEIERLIAAIPEGRTAERDKLIMMFSFYHGLRASELCHMRWDDFEFERARVHIRRIKRGDNAMHPLTGSELRALKRWQRHQPQQSQFVFTAWTAAPITRSTIYLIFKSAGELANIGFPVHPHMARHSTGAFLGAKGTDLRVIQAFLGHRNIQHTVRYVALDEQRFKGLFKD